MSTLTAAVTREAFSFDEAKREITRDSGGVFDPAVDLLRGPVFLERNGRAVMRPALEVHALDA